MEIADLKNELKECYDIKTKTCKIVQVPTIRYLMIDGFGDPNDSQSSNRVSVRFILSLTN